MSKIHTMAFEDGLKEIKVGDSCAYFYRASIIACKVKKVGPKYATMDNGKIFHCESGTVKSDYSNGYGRLHSSVDALTEINSVKQKTHECSSIANKIANKLTNSARGKLSRDQVEEIKTLLNEVEQILK